MQLPTLGASSTPTELAPEEEISTSSMSFHPFRHVKWNVSQQQHQSQADIVDASICHVWNRHSPEDLCAKGRWARLRLMREMSMFSRDCHSPAANVQLAQLFGLNQWAALKSEADLVSHTEHLVAGADARECILGATGSASCLECFTRLGGTLRQVERAYTAFERALNRFDCMIALDGASATRPFSPNGTCNDCKAWYRKWLLVQSAKLWEKRPCLNWCYYTQLACPHLATVKVVDFAGHPSFQCRDQNIGAARVGATGRSAAARHSSCESCLHPCDLHPSVLHPPSSGTRRRVPNALAEAAATHEASDTTADGSASLAASTADYFAVRDTFAHQCWLREKRCSKERKRRRGGDSEHLAYPAGATRKEVLGYTGSEPTKTERSRIVDTSNPAGRVHRAELLSATKAGEED